MMHPSKNQTVSTDIMDMGLTTRDGVAYICVECGVEEVPSEWQTCPHCQRFDDGLDGR